MRVTEQELEAEANAFAKDGLNCRADLWLRSERLSLRLESTC